jgi:hypothetical protein
MKPSVENGVIVWRLEDNRDCPNCKSVSVIHDGYCAQCRQCTLRPITPDNFDDWWDANKLEGALMSEWLKEGARQSWIACERLSELRLKEVQKELKVTKTLLAEKNVTANTFMNQVKRLQEDLCGSQQETQEWKDILARRDNHIVDQNAEIVQLRTKQDELKQALKSK